MSADNRFFAEILDAAHGEISRHAELVCRGCGLSIDSAPMLLNDASLKLLKAAPAFDCRRRLLPYYKSFVTNCGLDRVRYESRRRAKSLSSGDWDADEGRTGGAWEAIAPSIEDPAVQAASNEAVQRIVKAVSLLPGMEGPIMNAKIAGNNRREIAIKFGITPEKVSRLLHRARGRLRGELEMA